MRTIAAVLAAITFASALAGASEGARRLVQDAGPAPAAQGQRARAAWAILARAGARERALEAKLGAPRDRYTLTVLAIAKRAIRQDAEERLAAILTEEEMASVRHTATSPRIGKLRFLEI